MPIIGLKAHHKGEPVVEQGFVDRPRPVDELFAPVTVVNE